MLFLELIVYVGYCKKATSKVDSARACPESNLNQLV
jgi:hypothetical protein